MDSREYAHEWFEDFNEKKMTAVLKYSEDDNGEPLVIPMHYEVCDTCNAKGVVVNPSIDGNGLSREDFDDDPDFAEDYFSGVFDITCPHCKGKRVCIAPDFDNMTPDMAKTVTAAIEDYFEDQRSDARTRRMENGGY